MNSQMPFFPLQLPNVISVRYSIREQIFDTRVDLGEIMKLCRYNKQMLENVIYKHKHNLNH